MTSTWPPPSTTRAIWAKSPIEAARGLATGKTIPAFVDAGTQVVTQANAAEVKHDATFGEYRPGAL